VSGARAALRYAMALGAGAPGVAGAEAALDALQGNVVDFSALASGYSDPRWAFAKTYPA
jgi:hypothetical protein